MDSIEIGLITCSPHDEVYSLYGHTAIHVSDLRRHRDLVYNYGVFDFRKPHFIWRFMMGHTDYMLECYSDLNRWLDYYAKWGSEVSEQVLNLTATEKLLLLSALDANVKDPVYRYNFFFDNCCTRARNIIERCLTGALSYSPRPDYHPTFRQMVHQCTAGHRWAALGNDLLLGFSADREATQREQEFLPANLSFDFDHAVVTDSGGVRRPLVARRVVLVPMGRQPASGGFPLSPLACTLLLLLVSVLLFAYEWRRGRTLVWWDAMLMLSTGLSGCLLTVMLFSEHPATGTNLQVLLLNPLSLLFLPQVVRRRRTRWFKIDLFCILAFFIGIFFQDYAEGMEVVALCLLLRYCIHHRYDK